MGRGKLLIAKLPTPERRKSTYGKRSQGLLKKAYELSVLCDVDVALIMFSSTGKLTQFSSQSG
jgi:SRF-type transcription factor (DNA-binding and dimerisation domain)